MDKGERARSLTASGSWPESSPGSPAVRVKGQQRAEKGKSEGSRGSESGGSLPMRRQSMSGVVRYVFGALKAMDISYE